MRIVIIIALCFSTLFTQAAQLIIPMGDDQTDHLKAYGLAYWSLQQGLSVDWLLNYKGGSFSLRHLKAVENECIIRNIKYQIIADAQYTNILTEIAHPEANMDLVKLDKAPKIAVYSPKSKQPWDDAVTMVLSYAEIPYDVVYDDEVLGDKLATYDWLHLHHEDFTGQYGKFYNSYKNAPWYKAQVAEMEASANKHGFSKVSKLKLAVVHKIRDFVAGGGFLFAMCSATDSYDIALAAAKTDICDKMYDGDPPASNAQSQLDFTQTFAFENFKLRMNPLEYEYSNIDANFGRKVKMQVDYFTLFDFSAKWDIVPTILTQCHTKTVKGFMGQTTAFRKSLLKPNVLILGETTVGLEARYIHGEYGYGTWTFYGGHDPEDYRHFVGDPKTDLNLHPNSPGYRLILNNILFPAAKKKKQKT